MQVLRLPGQDEHSTGLLTALTAGTTHPASPTSHIQNRTLDFLQTCFPSPTPRALPVSVSGPCLSFSSLKPRNGNCPQFPLSSNPHPVLQQLLKLPIALNQHVHHLARTSSTANDKCPSLSVSRLLCVHFPCTESCHPLLGTSTRF